MPIKRKTIYTSEADGDCPCCGSRNVSTWESTNDKGKEYQVTMCNTCQFESFGGYVNSREDIKEHTYF